MKTLTKPDHLTYRQTVNHFLDILFEETIRRDWTLKDTARFSKLGYKTILRWNSREVKLPRLESVYKLGRALGFKIILERSNG